MKFRKRIWAGARCRRRKKESAKVETRTKNQRKKRSIERLIDLVLTIWFAFVLCFGFNFICCNKGYLRTSIFSNFWYVKISLRTTRVSPKWDKNRCQRSGTYLYLCSSVDSFWNNDKLKFSTVTVCAIFNFLMQPEYLYMLHYENHKKYSRLKKQMFWISKICKTTFLRANLVLRL